MRAKVSAIEAGWSIGWGNRRVTGKIAGSKWTHRKMGVKILYDSSSTINSF